MKKLLKILLLGTLTIFANPLIAQPPPPHLGDQGQIKPIPLESMITCEIWTITNHSNCDFNASLWFTFTDTKTGNQIGTNEYTNFGKWGNINSNTSFEINITTFALQQGYHIPGTSISNTALVIKVGDTPQIVFPNSSGSSTIITFPGYDAPCNCLRVDFDPVNKTIDIWPC